MVDESCVAERRMNVMMKGTVCRGPPEEEKLNVLARGSPGTRRSLNDFEKTRQDKTSPP